MDATASLTLKNKQLAELCGLRMSRFYQLKKAGLFRGLEAPIPGRWSRRKVEAWLAGERPALGRRKAS